MASVGGAAFNPSLLLGQRVQVQSPLQLQVRGQQSSHRSKADRAGTLWSSALLLSFLHTFLRWSIFEEPSKLISQGQGMRKGGVKEGSALGAKNAVDSPSAG